MAVAIFNFAQTQLFFDLGTGPVGQHDAHAHGLQQGDVVNQGLEPPSVTSSPGKAMTKVLLRKAWM